MPEPTPIAPQSPAHISRRSNLRPAAKLHRNQLPAFLNAAHCERRRQRFIFWNLGAAGAHSTAADSLGGAFIKFACGAPVSVYIPMPRRSHTRRRPCQSHIISKNLAPVHHHLREAGGPGSSNSQARIRGPPTPTSASLQELILDHGTYDRITPEAWPKFGAAMEDWKAFVRGGGLHESY